MRANAIAVLLFAVAATRGAPGQAADWTITDQTTRPTEAEAKPVPLFPEDLQRIVSDGEGGLFALWLSTRSGTLEVHGEHLDGAGRPRWGRPGAPLQISMAAPGRPLKFQVLADASGGAVVGWLRVDAQGAGALFAQRLSGDGKALWGKGVNLSGGSPALAFTAAAAGDGGAVFHLLRPADERTMTAVAQRLGSGGEMLWGKGVALMTLSRDRALPAVVPGEAPGSALFFLPSVRPAAGDSLRHLALKLGPDGAVLWGPTVFSDREAPGAFLAALSDGGGGAFVVWSTQAGPERSRDLRASRVDASGKFSGPPGASGWELTRGQRAEDPELAGDGSGGTWLVWSDSKGSADREDRLLHLAGDARIAPGFSVNGVLLGASAAVPALTALRDAVYAFNQVTPRQPRSYSLRMHKLALGSGPRLLLGEAGYLFSTEVSLSSGALGTTYLTSMPGTGGTLLVGVALGSGLYAHPVPADPKAAAPGRVWAAAVGVKAVTWVWEWPAAHPPEKFRVYGRAGKLLAELPGETTSYTQSGLRPGSTAQIRVEAVHGGLRASVLSPEVVAAPPAPGVPGALRLGTGAIEWGWSPPPGPVDALQVRSAEGWPLARLGPGATHFLQTGLQAGATHQIRLVALAASVSSAVVSMPVYLPVFAPSGLHPLELGADSIRWGWDKVPGAEGLRVYSATGILATLDAGATEFLQTGLKPGGPGEVRLEVFSAGASSAAWSGAVPTRR